MQQLEQKLDELLVKKAPFQIPQSGRESIVKIMPYLTIIGGVLMLWVAAWFVYQALTVVSSLSEIYGVYVGPYINTAAASPILWASLALLVVEAVMFFIAFPALRARKKSGWNILFWVAIINVVQSIFQVIAYAQIGSLIMSLLSAALGMYILFQIRAMYTGEAPKATGGTPPTPPASTPPSPTPPANQ